VPHPLDADAAPMSCAAAYYRLNKSVKSPKDRDRYLVADTSIVGNRLMFINDYREEPYSRWGECRHCNDRCANICGKCKKDPCDTVRTANCKIVMTEMGGLKWPGFISTKDIGAGEELLCDYGPGYWNIGNIFLWKESLIKSIKHTERSMLLLSNALEAYSGDHADLDLTKAPLSGVDGGMTLSCLLRKDNKVSETDGSDVQDDTLSLSRPRLVGSLGRAYEEANRSCLLSRKDNIDHSPRSSLHESSKSLASLLERRTPLMFGRSKAFMDITEAPAIVVARSII